MNDPFTAIIEAVKVHVVNAHEIAPAAPAAAPETLEISTWTVVLTAGKLSDELLAYDGSRAYALLQVFDHNAVLCMTASQADSARNADAALANPDGSLLTTGIVVPVKGASRLWVAAPAACRISVIAANRRARLT